MRRETYKTAHDKDMEEQLNLKHIEITLSVQITRKDRDCDRDMGCKERKTHTKHHIMKTPRKN